MKALILTVAMGVACVSAIAQGTLNFANFGPGLNAKVTDWNGVGLSGGAWAADLYWAQGTVTDSSLLMALGTPANFSTKASQAGYFFGGPRTIPGVAGGSTITAQVRVWDTASGSSWLQVWQNVNPNTRLGESVLFQVTLADPNAFPPGIPTTMTALNGHPWGVYMVWIPEPSILALAGLGLVWVAILRRRR